MKSQDETFDYASIPVGYYDEVHSRGRGMQSFWHQLKFESVARNVEDSPKMSILDIACGPGTFLGNYIKHSRGVGIDLAVGQVEYAQRTYGSDKLTFHTASSEQINIDFSVFQTVTCIEFIEHISEPELQKVLADVQACLEPDGNLVITTPNYRGLWPLLEWCMDKFAKGPTYDQQHITHWNRARIREFLESNGFKVISISGIHGVAPFLAPFNWKIARIFARLEEPIVKRSGFLLLVKATKSNSAFG